MNPMRTLEDLGMTSSSQRWGTSGEHPGIRALISGHQHSVPTTSFKPPRGWGLNSNQNRKLLKIPLDWYKKQASPLLGGSKNLRASHIQYMIEGSLEVKLPTMWTNGKAEVGRVREEKGRREKIREEKRCRCEKRSPPALHSTFHFWRKSRRIVSFLMLSTWKIEEVSQNSFV